MTVAGLMGYLDSFSPQEELSIEIPNIFSQRCLYLIQSNDSRDFEHPRVHSIIK